VTLEEYLAIPFVMAVESYEGPDGEWFRRASYPELPECTVEGFWAVDIIDKLEELRVRRIIELYQKGDEIPVPRAPLRSAMPVLNREQLEFAKYLVEHGHLTDSR